MGTYAVTYTYAAGTEIERDVHRPQHKDFLATLHGAGSLRASGPVDGGIGALLLMEADSAEQVTEILDDDPFHQNGLIADRTIREWTVVFGGLR